MVSVTRDNVKDLLSEIEANIRNAVFVAIDTEFSGLNLGPEALRESRFDSAEERYSRIRQNVKEASLLQFGIACFLSGHTEPPADDSDEYADSVYKVVCYNIVLAPADLGLLELRPKSLNAEWAALRFLRSHEFDLNQVVAVGVPYMKAQDIQKFCESARLGTGILRRSAIDPDSLRQAEGEVQQLQKIIDGDVGKSKEFIFKDLKTSPYILHTLLREIHPEIWTIPLTWNSLRAEVVGPIKRLELEQKDRTLEEWIIKESTMGGRIFASLVRERKVIIGFQLLSDILFLIEAFYGNLPEDYADFKNLIQDLFPNMYDGKVIGHLLSRHERINTFRHFDAPSLLELYTTLTTPKSFGMFMHAPQFQHDPRHTFYAWEAHAHEAAYDSYMAGVVFLYSIFAMAADEIAELRSRTIQSTVHPVENSVSSKRPVRDGSNTCHTLPPLVLRKVRLELDIVAEYCGLLYLHLSADKFLNIFGDDEQANRSKAWVRLTAKNGNMPIADSQIVKAYLEALAYEHQIRSPNEIVIACTTSDRAVKVAEYARRTLGVRAEIVDCASIRKTRPGNPPVGTGKVIFGVLLTSLLGYACLAFMRTKR